LLKSLLLRALLALFDFLYDTVIATLHLLTNSLESGLKQTPLEDVAEQFVKNCTMRIAYGSNSFDCGFSM